MYKFANWLARGCALLGGCALCALVVLVCLSIVGRSLNGILHSDLIQAHGAALANTLLAWGVGPVNGDFEIVEAGMAFVIFAFLPLCQLSGAHASVNIFSSLMSPRVLRISDFVIALVFAAVLVAIAWQLFEGMESKRKSAQVTFLLQYPLWWAYAASLFGAVASAVVACYIAVSRLAELVTGQTILPSSEPDSAH